MKGSAWLGEGTHGWNLWWRVWAWKRLVADSMCARSVMEKDQGRGVDAATGRGQDRKHSASRNLYAIAHEGMCEQG